ncbi:MAG: hypothetical protein ACR2MN_03240 [Acidimicrobiales bacterium]
MVTAPVLAALTGRSKPAVGHAVDQLMAAGVLLGLSEAARNRAWEAAGLLDLLAGVDAG